MDSGTQEIVNKEGLIKSLRLNMEFGEEKIEQVLSILEKTINLLILGDPILGLTGINLKVLTERVIGGLYEENCSLDLREAIERLSNMSSIHCEEIMCLQCSFCMRCPLAILTKVIDNTSSN